MKIISARVFCIDFLKEGEKTNNFVSWIHFRSFGKIKFGSESFSWIRVRISIKSESVTEPSSMTLNLRHIVVCPNNLFNKIISDNKRLNHMLIDI